MQKLLILSSNPDRDLNLNREIADLITSIQRLGNFEIRFGLEACSHQLPELLAEHSPQVIHFCGHGAGREGLVFQDEDGRKQVLSTEILARIFKTFSTEINCAVLNACESNYQAEAIVEHINYVIGMSQPILDKAAHLFSIGFYKGLSAGKTIEQAYEMGCIAIQIWSETNSQSTQFRQYRRFEYTAETTQPEQFDLPEHLKPVLLKKMQLSSPSKNTSLLSPLPKPLSNFEYNATEQDVIPNESVNNNPTRSDSPALIHLEAGFVDFIKDGIERKEYKDNVRDSYDNFGQFSASRAANLTKLECKQRKVFLGKVKQFWIKGFLEPSLRNSPTIKLDRKNYPGIITNLPQEVETLSIELDNSFEDLRKTRVYEEIGQGRTLLILGDPGSGKTIALLQLTQRLIEFSENDLSLPMPVVFNLSSWAKDQEAIADWVANELWEKYQVSKSLSRVWIESQQLILLLDGLDEVREEKRNNCIRALNEFIYLYPQIEIAVCCRLKDYEALNEHLQISSALCIQPFSIEQIYQYLDEFGGALSGLKEALISSSDLEQIAQNPLILHLMSVSYQGWSSEKLSSHLSGASDHFKQHIFDTYISNKLENNYVARYRKVDVLTWLAWLASQMIREKQTIFLIERMQPTWLESYFSRICYKIGTLIFSGLLGGLISFIFSILHFKFVFLLLHEAFIEYYGGKTIDEKSLLNGLGIIILIGISSSTIMAALSENIAPLGQISWSWQKFQKRLSSQLVIGAKSGIILAISLGFILAGKEFIDTGRGDLGVFFTGCLYGVVFFPPSIMLLFGLGAGLSDAEVTRQVKPNQGILNSLKSCFVTGCVPEILFLLWVIYLGLNSYDLPPGQVVFGLNAQLLLMLSGGLILGIIAGFRYGGITCIQHFTLRYLLYKRGKIPWNYAKFLNFSSSSFLMKKVGGGYIFFHRMLLEHFNQKYQANDKP